MVRMRLGENPPTLAESERARGPFPLPRAAPAAMALQWTAAGRGRRYDAAGRRRRKGIRRPRRRRSQGLTNNVAELYIYNCTEWEGKDAGLFRSGGSSPPIEDGERPISCFSIIAALVLSL